MFRPGTGVDDGGNHAGPGNQGGGGSASIGTSVDYVPVPEPGTALLMGLGLAGLGLAGRRKA